MLLCKLISPCTMLPSENMPLLDVWRSGHPSRLVNSHVHLVVFPQPVINISRHIKAFSGCPLIVIIFQQRDSLSNLNFFHDRLPPCGDSMRPKRTHNRRINKFLTQTQFFNKLPHTDFVKWYNFKIVRFIQFESLSPNTSFISYDFIFILVVLNNQTYP